MYSKRMGVCEFSFDKIELGSLILNIVQHFMISEPMHVTVYNVYLFIYYFR